MYIKRTLNKTIEKINNQFPVIMLTGPRQVGKTTFLKKSSDKSRKYVTLDDLGERERAKEDPGLFLQKFKPPLLIDEIQYAAELLSYIKIDVDQNNRNGVFWLTGSQKFHLMHEVSESLAGRVAIINMLGLSLKEIENRGDYSKPFLPDNNLYDEEFKTYGLKDIYNIIWKGSYPFLYKSENTDRDLFYQSYVNTYIERDIRNLTQVGDERAFFRFLRAAAARTAQTLNYTDMARDTGISVNTAKKWLSLLETSGIIYLLEPYYINRSVRLAKTPKLYFVDTGLCAYLTNWNSPETLEGGAMSGAFFETFVIIELIKSYLHNGKKPPFFYYRDSNRNEIDLIIEKDGFLFPVEIKKTTRPSKKHIRHFRLLEKKGNKIGRGAVICLMKEWAPISENVDAYNVGVI